MVFCFDRQQNETEPGDAANALRSSLILYVRAKHINYEAIQTHTRFGV